MNAWIIVGVYFLGVFSYRIVSTLLSYTHSYNFLIYCFACCLTLIKTFGKDAAEVLELPEEEKEKLEKRMETTFQDWQTAAFVRVVAVVPKEFRKILKSEDVSGKLKNAFSEVNSEEN
jgi:hypothetical protein